MARRHALVSTALLTALLAALALPAAPRAQTLNLQGRADRAPVGIAVPGLSVATAEEATALQVNPAGIGFVDAPALHYFHQGRSGTGLGADGFWLATPLGALVPALSTEWIRPQDGFGSRFRKTTLGLALGGPSGSLGIAWNWFASPDRDLEALGGLDAGFTLRPARFLSLGLSALGIDARLGNGVRLPTRYGLGLGTRLWRDRLTLSGDLYADDQARGSLRVRTAAVGAGLEWTGFALGFQLGFPVRSGEPGAASATYGQLALTWNQPHSGTTFGGAGGGEADRTWLVGVRASAERYRAEPLLGSGVPALDLERQLSRGRGLFGGDRDPYGTLLRALAEVRDDASVPALAVRVRSLPVGQGRVEELRRLLLEVKAKKPVLAYVEGGGMKEYYLASAASLVVAPPSAALFPNGLVSSTPFVKATLDKLGVTFDVVAAGRYKNAPEPLVREDMGEAQREVTNRLLDDLFARQVRGIAEARRLTEPRVRELVDTGGFTAEEARQAGLVDAVAFPDELDGALSAKLGRPVRLGAGWDRTSERGAQRWGRRPAVALIRVEGTIAQGKSRGQGLGMGAIAGADTLTQLVARAAADGDVKAIVLRVESPGGDGLASDLVWREVMQARRKGKPVVVSMGDVAASGGYLVAVGADAIVAEPSTLTGSIGVFALKPDLSGLLGKLGARLVTLKRGENADLEAVTKRWTPREREVIERQVAAFYDLFLKRVAEGRRLERSAVEKLAEGQVWTGAQALERGLVDRLGSLDDALRLARERAGLAEDDGVEVQAFEPDRSFLGDLAGGFAADARADDPLAALAARLPELHALSALLAVGPVVALPPEWIPLTGAPAAPR
jgi:protease-4